MKKLQVDTSKLRCQPIPQLFGTGKWVYSAVNWHVAQSNNSFPDSASCCLFLLVNETFVFVCGVCIDLTSIIMHSILFYFVSELTKCNYKLFFIFPTDVTMLCIFEGKLWSLMSSLKIDWFYANSIPITPNGDGLNMRVCSGTIWKDRIGFIKIKALKNRDN